MPTPRVCNELTVVSSDRDTEWRSTSSDAGLVIGVVMARFARAMGRSMYFITNGNSSAKCCSQSGLLVGKADRGEHSTVCVVGLAHLSSKTTEERNPWK